MNQLLRTNTIYRSDCWRQGYMKGSGENKGQWFRESSGRQVARKPWLRCRTGSNLENGRIWRIKNSNYSTHDQTHLLKPQTTVNLCIFSQIGICHRIYHVTKLLREMSTSTCHKGCNVLIRWHVLPYSATNPANLKPDPRQRPPMGCEFALRHSPIPCFPN